MIDRTLAGRYQLTRLLGQGTIAEVYEATDLQLGRSVAVKLLRAPLAADQAIAGRFLREARLSAGLTHPGIVSVFDVGEDAGQPFMVMELVDGSALRRHVDEQAPFELGDVITVARQVAEALDYAHTHGVLHRDLKPQNVLMTAGGRVKLTDFGLARGSGAATLTGQQAIMGSARYLAPEQVQGQESDARTDVYALGVMLFEMLTGRLPFQGETPVEVAAQHLRSNPPPPSRFNPAVPRQADVAVLKALAKDPRQRFASAGSLVDTLALAEPRKVEAGSTTTVMPRVRVPRAVATEAYAGEPTVMLPLPRPRERAAGYWTGLIVGMIGFGFVVAAFLAGQEALKHTPLAAAGNLPQVPGAGIRLPAPPQAINLVSTPAATAAVALSPFPTETPTETATVTPTVTVTATVSETPGPTETPGARVSPAAPTPPPAAAVSAQPTALPQQVTVPNVVGMTEADAQKTIAAAGLTPTFPNYQTYTSQPSGHVLSQTPSAGSVVQRGTTIYIAVRR
ncbi:MAG: protein kinase [Chloroflexota bacterium]|nr:protein kinase [Chloroflexota bacterium]